MNLAYENVKEVDGLDISREGTEMWEAALKRYDERIDRVEVSFGNRKRILMRWPASIQRYKGNSVRNVLLFAYLVDRQESRLGFVTNLGQQRMPTKCFESSPGSMHFSCVLILGGPFENTRLNLFRELKMTSKTFMKSSR